ncbi:MAG: SRPBCC domain-containing protein [Actinomycetota bacterium]
MTLSVTTPTDREIVLTRSFIAPGQLVFDAYTKPELLTRWYGARGWNLIGCDFELREGGRYRFESLGPHGDTMVQTGTVRQIRAPIRLVLTELFEDQSYPGETLITHEFSEHSGQTTVTTTVRYATPEGRDAVLRYPMARGVGESGDRLVELLTDLDVNNRKELP